MRNYNYWEVAACAACFFLGMASGFGSERAKLTATNGGGNDEFGVAVSLQGGMAVVGSFRDDSVNLSSGSAYIYRFDGAQGTWEELAHLVASDGAAGDSFGNAVALGGGLIVIGAVGNDGATGSAYVFARDEGGPDAWGEAGVLWASDGAALHQFGASVSVDGSTVAVGATSHESINAPGAVYLFVPNGTHEWVEVAKIQASDGAGLNLFGSAVALDGDRLAVGVPGDSDNSANAGAAYIYERNAGGAGEWGLVRKVTLSDFSANDRFGSALDLSGDVLVVGASQADVATKSGRAFVFERNRDGANLWGLVRELEGLEIGEGARFGASVSIAGGLVVVGAPGESRAGFNAGAAHVFDSRSQWGWIGRLVGSDTSAEFRFGADVSVDGSEVLVGAPGDNYGGLNSGSAYLFSVSYRPVLSIDRSGADVIVSWTPAESGFELQESPDLFPESWTPETSSAGANPATLSATGAARFFRVVGPGPLELAFVPVGTPGNTGDSTGLGQVSRSYQIGQFEVTNEEYVRFLNAVAATDTHGLYNDQMGADARGGIERVGIAGDHTYAVKPSMGNKPVNHVSFHDAARFANWLHNGQPTGSQEPGTTEDGAYTFPSAQQVGPRNAGAKVWVPDVNEWYKAAYYDPTKNGVGGYWLNPTRSDETPVAATSDASGSVGNGGVNVANYGFGASWNGLEGNVTSVGSAGAGSRSFFGAADMGGNVAEWNESSNGALRGLRGGSWADFESALEAASGSNADAASENDTTGFRVARP